MRAQIKRKLAPITSAKLHILYSKSKEAMKVKCSLFDGRNGVSLSISGAKLGISFGQRMGKFCFLFLVSKFRFLDACFGSIIGTTWLPNFE